MTPITVDISPLKTFNYNQIPNHNFCLALVGPDYKILHTPSTCKDYLQDMFWCEYTKHTADIYGLKWTPGIIDLTQKRFYLALFGGDVVLSEIKDWLQEFINYFDDSQKIDRTIVMETTDPKVLVVEFDREWTLSGPMLSAFTTLIRVSGPYKGGDPIPYLIEMYNMAKTNAPNIINMIVPKYSIVDISRLTRTFKRLLALLAGKVFSYDWNNIKNTMSAHETGIVGYADFPEAELPEGYTL
jgi:hypothetical protein